MFTLRLLHYTEDFCSVVLLCHQVCYSTHVWALLTVISPSSLPIPTYLGKAADKGDDSIMFRIGR